jgi:predicted esterase
MKPTYLVVNGILTQPGSIEGWTDIFEDYYQNLGIPCSRYEYFSGALTRFLGQKKRVNELCKMLNRIDRPVVYVGHSNGCELFSKLVKKTDCTFVAAHLFAPAVHANFWDNGFNQALLNKRVNNIYIYCSKNDKVLKNYASRTSWLKFMGLGYGTLGQTGPDSILKGVEGHVYVTWENRYGHSDWFKTKNIEKSFGLTLRQ